MLNQSSLEKGGEMATNYQVSGINLTPKIGTPLGNLLNTAHIPYFEDRTAAEMVQESVTPLNANYDPHTNYLQMIAQQASDRILANITEARNTINPLINDIYQACLDEQDSLMSNSPLNVETKMVGVPMIFRDSNLSDLAANYRDQTQVPQYPPISMQLRTEILNGLTDESLIENLNMFGSNWTTEVTELVGLAHDWLENINMGTDFVSSLLNEVTGITANSVSVFQNPMPALNLLVCKAVLAGRFNLSGSGLTMEDQTTVARLSAYYGSTLIRQLKLITEFRSSGRFVIPIGSDPRNVVYLYQLNLSEWLAKDETNNMDLVMGALASSGMGNGNLLMVSMGLISEPQQYANDFARIQKRETVRVVNISADSFKQIIDHRVCRFIVETYPESDSRLGMCEQVHQYLKDHTLRLNNELLPYVRKMVCEILVPKTMVFDFLNEIDNYMNADETMTIDQAANYAAATLTARWLMSQVQVQQYQSNIVVLALDGNI